MAGKDVVEKHIAAVCEEAGLQVMTQIYQITYDREEVTGRALLALTPDEVKHHYRLAVGPAIDSIEQFMEEDDEPDGAPCCPDPGCPRNPCTFPGYAANH